MAVLMNKNKASIVAALVAALLFVMAAVHQSGQQSQPLEHFGSAMSSAKNKVWPFKPAKTFYDIAQEHGTDKVTDHSYYDMYQKYFPALRNKRIKMLEIGLGCDMVSHSSTSIVEQPCRLIGLTRRDRATDPERRIIHG